MRKVPFSAAMALFLMPGFASWTGERQGPVALRYAQEIRLAYDIPEIAFAAVSSDGVIESGCIGVRIAGTPAKAAMSDRFHIGSNTKAVTGLIAALLVKENKVGWKTRFFDLLPDMKPGSNPAYADVALVDLLSHRARIRPFMEGSDFPNPLETRFKGGVASQRRQFVRWVLTLDPVESKEPYTYSNAGYSAAAVMLEKASGKTWEELVTDLGDRIGIRFGFSWPNLGDSSQPWGHWGTDKGLIPTPPDDYYRLNWVEPAGDLNIDLGDYIRFVQLQLQGLQGRNDLLTKEEFEFLHFGIPDHYAIGWGWGVNAQGHHVSAHNGSAETFISYVYIIREIDRAYIILVNSGGEKADKGVAEMLKKLLEEFGK